MAYIGRGLDKLSNVDVLNTFSFTDSAGPYNITKGSPAVAFIPSAVQNLLIEVDGVIQASASYTITGSTITFGVSMSSSSTMNSFIHFGMGVTMTPADGTVSTVKIVDDAVTTAKILDANVTNAKLAGSITDAKITGLSSSKLTGALPAISGASLTALNATNIGSGTVPTARLGSGSASSSVFLAGDNTWAAAGGGKVGAVVHTAKTDTFTVTANQTWTDVTDLTVTTGTLAATSSKVLVMASVINFANDYCAWRVVDGDGAIITGFVGDADGSRTRSTSGNLYETSAYIFHGPMTFVGLDSPAATAAQTYKVQVFTNSSTASYVNVSRQDSDNTTGYRGVSTITTMEILV